jgi:DNA-binding NarL/FixJ family response regulator
MRRLKVVIADDHRLMLDAIRVVLEDDGGFEIVGSTESGAAVVPMVARTRPDAVLLDLRMPSVDGLVNLDRLQREHSGIPVLVLSGSDDHDLIRETLRRGARAFISKTVVPEDLAAIIRHTVSGTVYQSFGQLQDEPAGDSSPLSTSQLRVLRALVRGLTNKEIAGELWLSEQTVKFHLSNIYKLLGVKSRADAIRHAYEQRIVDVPIVDVPAERVA